MLLFELSGIANINTPCNTCTNTLLHLLAQLNTLATKTIYVHIELLSRTTYFLRTSFYAATHKILSRFRVRFSFSS